MADVRLIDANVLTDVIEGMDWYHIGLQGNLVHGANSDIHTPLYKADDIYQALKNAPTINPEDCRPQGEWIDMWIDMQEDYITEGVWRCSMCSSDRFFDGWTPDECGCYYCPNCGAKMDGKEQQEKACDTCRFYPPSSFDGKPCSQCSDDYSCWQRKEQGDER